MRATDPRRHWRSLRQKEAAKPKLLLLVRCDRAKRRTHPSACPDTHVEIWHNTRSPRDHPPLGKNGRGAVLCPGGCGRDYLSRGGGRIPSRQGADTIYTSRGGPDHLERARRILTHHAAPKS